MLPGIVKSFATSQVSSAWGSVDRNVTVSYGPTTDWLIAWTEPPKSALVLAESLLAVNPQPAPPPPQLGVGP